MCDELSNKDRALLDLLQEEPEHRATRQMLSSLESEIRRQELEEWWAARPAGLYGGSGSSIDQRLSEMLDELERTFGK